MRSIGLDLQPRVDAGLLRFEAARPSLFGLEMHLARMYREIEEFAPAACVLDPISALRGETGDVHSMLLRVVDLLKSRGITAFLTDLLSVDGMDKADAGMSSLMDTWLSLVQLESNGERNRGIYVLKSRGMNHSNQIREFVLSDSGIQLADVYLGPDGMLTGSARVAQEARERAAHQSLGQEVEWQKLALERKRAAVEGQIAALRAEFSAEEATIEHILRKDQQHEASLVVNRAAMGRSRRDDPMGGKTPQVRRNGTGGS